MQWRDSLLARFPKLRLFGAETYVVGGAIRDLLLGRDPLDVDIACHDPLEAARTIRPRVIRLGSHEHLSAYRVVDGEHVYDFAALEGGAIEPDLARRDFTVNAMAVELATGELLDLYDGQGDIDRRLVRMVDASNFDDDPLRTLKGVRMAVRYGFEIEATTLEAMRQRAGRILEVAAERVTYELSIIFSSGEFARAVEMLARSGLAQALGFRLLEPRASDVSVAGAYALLVEEPRAFAARWRWSDALLREVLTLQQLVEHHDRIALYDAGERIALQLDPVLRALGCDPTLDQPDFGTQPLLGGNEIAAALSVAPGPELGRIKRALLEAQLLGSVRTYDEALAFVQRQDVRS